MRFRDTPIAGAWLVEPDPHRDERGFFARTHDEDLFASRGLVGRFRQSSVSHNARAGTVRGMHYSVGPRAETKLVRCTAGAIHDVLVDLRPGAPSFRTVAAFDLTAANGHGLYVPAGVAHGFQARVDGTEVLYLIDEPYDPAAARGLRWTDPCFAICWPDAVTVISARDDGYPDWVPPA